jgi:hypothetical protein
MSWFLDNSLPTSIKQKRDPDTPRFKMRMEILAEREEFYLVSEYYCAQHKSRTSGLENAKTKPMDTDLDAAV